MKIRNRLVLFAIAGLLSFCVGSEVVMNKDQRLSKAEEKNLYIGIAGIVDTLLAHPERGRVFKDNLYEYRKLFSVKAQRSVSLATARKMQHFKNVSRDYYWQDMYVTKKDFVKAGEELKVLLRENIQSSK